MKTLQFKRLLSAARPFEKSFLTAVADAGTFFPADKLSDGRLESQLTRQGTLVTEGTVDVFYLMETFHGEQYIDIVLQPIPGIRTYASYIWPGSDGTANAMLEDRFKNGRVVISSKIDGETIEFVYEPEFGQYLPSVDMLRDKVLEATSRRRRYNGR